MKAGLWGVTATHLAFSALTSTVVCAYLALNPSSLHLAPAARGATPWVPQALIAASAGFFGFVLWAEVSNRCGGAGRPGGPDGGAVRTPASLWSACTASCMQLTQCACSGCSRPGSF